MIIVWRVTQLCDLACPFCAYDRRLSGPRASIAAERVLRFGEALADYQHTRRDRVLLSWLGGEPFLWPPLGEVSARLGDLGIAQSATTNGTSLTSPAVRSHVLAHFAELTVSVDAFAPAHDALRAWPDGFRQLREAVADLAARRRDRSLKLRANVVLMRETLPTFADLCETLADWGIDEITFNALGGRDRPEFFPAHRLRPTDAATLSAQLPGLRSRLSARGVRLCGGSAYLNRIASSARDERLPVADCAPGEGFLFIDEYGKIAPCSFTTDSIAASIDEIQRATDLAALAVRFSDRQMQAPAAVCGDCPSTQVFSKFAA
jgi:MoaA/NifB/PqqE/SkfB family radical SAM enzyme